MLPGNGEGMNFQEIIIFLSLKLISLNFQENIYLVNYWTSSRIHIYWLTFCRILWLFHQRVKLVHVKENWLPIHLVFTDSDASVGSWLTVSPGNVVSFLRPSSSRDPLSQQSGNLKGVGESEVGRRLHVSLIIAALPGPRLICFWCHRQAWGRVSHSQS